MRYWAHSPGSNAARSGNRQPICILHDLKPQHILERFSAQPFTLYRIALDLVLLVWAATYIFGKNTDNELGKAPIAPWTNALP